MDVKRWHPEDEEEDRGLQPIEGRGGRAEPGRLFEELALPALDDLYRFACRLERDPARAADLLQEALLTGFRKFGQLGGAASFRSWMATIVRRTFLNRSRRSEPTVSLEHAGFQKARPGVCSPARPGPDERLLARRLSREIRTALDELAWPQWRGPLGAGLAPHADPPVAWSEGKNVRWKVELPGRGHSTPVEVGAERWAFGGVAGGDGRPDLAVATGDALALYPGSPAKRRLVEKTPRWSLPPGRGGGNGAAGGGGGGRRGARRRGGRQRPPLLHHRAGDDRPRRRRPCRGAAADQRPRRAGAAHPGALGGVSRLASLREQVTVSSAPA